MFREQTKPGYQELKRNQEVEKFQKQEPKRNQEDKNLGINKRNQNQERNQKLQAKIHGSTRNFLA
jgi:hypothetical protein